MNNKLILNFTPTGMIPTKAMTQHVPVSVSEIVEDGVNGFLVPSGATDQFAQAMFCVLKNPDLARKFGQAGRRKVEQKFTVERMVSRSEALFTEWVNYRGYLYTPIKKQRTGF